jgi:toxin ParE1/3/4
VLDLIWEPEADDQLNAIADFISRRNPVAAESIVERVHSGAERIRHFPQSGRPGRVLGTRELIVHPNYIVIYQITDTAIDVLRVLHARQRYP